MTLIWVSVKSGAPHSDPKVLLRRGCAHPMRVAILRFTEGTMSRRLARAAAHQSGIETKTHRCTDTNAGEIGMTRV